MGKLYSKLASERAELKRAMDRRKDLLERGEAAVSDYDKMMGYGLDFNLCLNQNHISYSNKLVAELESEISKQGFLWEV